MTTLKENMSQNTDKKWLFKLAFVTLWSIFVMGYINGMAINSVYMGVPVTPQTGNIIWMGLFPAFANWWAFGQTLILWGAFMGGAIVALYTGGLFKNPKVQFFYAWSTFAIPVVLYTMLLQHQTTAMGFILLGFASGTTLGFFRRVYHVDQLNTAMATGNARFVGLHLARIFTTKDGTAKRKEVKTFIIFFLAIFAFAFGAYLYGMAFRMDAYLLGGDALAQYARFVGDGPAMFGEHMVGTTYYLTHGFGVENGFGAIYFDHPEYSGFNFRNIALIVFCVIPYFFFPRGARKEPDAS
jgi:hypothetical protein